MRVRDERTAIVLKKTSEGGSAPIKSFYIKTYSDSNLIDTQIRNRFLGKQQSYRGVFLVKHAEKCVWSIASHEATEKQAHEESLPEGDARIFRAFAQFVRFPYSQRNGKKLLIFRFIIHMDSFSSKLILKSLHLRGSSIKSVYLTSHRGRLLS